MNEEEILAAASKIEQDRRRKYQAECTERHLREAKERTAREQALAAKLGVTWEQFQEIDDYVTNREWKNR